MYSLSPGSGWINEARQLHSPNCDQRPEGAGPELIVIHGISLPPGEYGGSGIDQLFSNTLNPDEHPYYREIAGLEVSSHLLIRRDGELVQYVDLFDRAWHAGASCHDGRECCNDFSIGIELEGTDEEPYTENQYAVLAEVISMLRKAIPTLETAPLVGHSDIAPGRKTDPGPAFIWEDLHSRLV